MLRLLYHIQKQLSMVLTLNLMKISSKVVFATKMLTFFAWFNLELEDLFHSSALKMYRQRFDHYSLVEDSILYVITGIPCFLAT